MPILYNKKNTCISIWKWVQKYSSLVADKFGTDRRLVKEIFVDETLLQIEMVKRLLALDCIRTCTKHICLMMHPSRGKGPFLYVISFSNNFVIGMAEN
jgi:hypothetical protein